MITVYPVVDHGTDGRDSVRFAYFTHKEDAERAVKGHGAMGHGDGTVDPAITVYQSFEDYEENNPEAVRERALAKLTPEEKKALGFQ